MANTTKTNYSCVIFHKDKNIAPLKFEFVKSIYYLHNYLKRINYDYHYINVYHRKTRTYLKRQYCNEFIVDKPPFSF